MATKFDLYKIEIPAVAPIPEGDVEITATLKMAGAGLSAEELSIFYQEVLQYYRFTPKIQMMILENIDRIVDGIRVVKHFTKEEYRGAFAEGNQLDVLIGTAQALIGSLTWLKSYTSTGVQDLIGTDASPRSLSEETAEIVVGFINEIDVPKSIGYLFKKDGKDCKHWEPLNWVLDEDSEIHVASIKEPFLCPPKHNWQLKLKIGATGDDKTQPVVFKVYVARNITDGII